MTEEEAKKKWCPFARSIGWEMFRDGEQAVTMNRMPDGAAHTGCLCLGSACMAWGVRWNPGSSYCKALPERSEKT